MLLSRMVEIEIEVEVEDEVESADPGQEVLYSFRGIGRQHVCAKGNGAVRLGNNRLSSCL
jgi:hypothetical protein